MTKQSVFIASFTGDAVKCFILVYKLQHTLKQSQQSNAATLQIFNISLFRKVYPTRWMCTELNHI